MALIEPGTDLMRDRARFGRYGRLVPQFGAPAAEQVRASCDACGAHLLAVTLGDGSVFGTCSVCLEGQVTPVARPHAAA